MKKILTDNASDLIIAKWDGIRFALVNRHRSDGAVDVIILNPKEMLDLIEFANKAVK